MYPGKRQKVLHDEALSSDLSITHLTKSELMNAALFNPNVVDKDAWVQRGEC